MSGKKVQGALKYLMIYGWIIILVIAGIVLWHLGIFEGVSPGTSVTSSGFAKLKPLLTSCKMTTRGAFTCLFTNGASSSITVNYFGASINGSACSTTSLPSGSFERGDNFWINTSGCKNGIVGDAYVLDVNIGYTLSVAENNVTRNDTGKLRGPIESA